MVDGIAKLIGNILLKVSQEDLFCVGMTIFLLYDAVILLFCVGNTRNGRKDHSAGYIVWGGILFATLIVMREYAYILVE